MVFQGTSNNTLIYYHGICPQNHDGNHCLKYNGDLYCVFCSLVLTWSDQNIYLILFRHFVVLHDFLHEFSIKDPIIFLGLKIL